MVEGDAPVLALTAQPFISTNAFEQRLLYQLAKPKYAKTLAKFNQMTLYTSVWPFSGIYTHQYCWTCEYVALPLFILMGEILYKSGISEKLFKALVPWLYRLPGGLLLMNIVSCTLFAAVSGSSAATTATVGRITLAEFDKLGYDRSLAMGSLAGAGTLGFWVLWFLP